MEIKKGKIYPALIKNFAIIFAVVVLLHVLERIIFKSSIPHSINAGMILGLIPANQTAIVLAAIIFILFGLSLSRYSGFYLWISLVMFGIGSIVLERIIFGGALDYLKVWFLPAFNFADILIVLGIVGITVKYFKSLFNNCS